MALASRSLYSSDISTVWCRVIKLPEKTTTKKQYKWDFCELFLRKDKRKRLRNVSSLWVFCQFWKIKEDCWNIFMDHHFLAPCWDFRGFTDSFLTCAIKWFNPNLNQREKKWILCCNGLKLAVKYSCFSGSPLVHLAFEPCSILWPIKHSKRKGHVICQDVCWGLTAPSM